MFGAALAELGIEVTSWDRPRGMSFEDDLRDFAEHVNGADVVGGVSYGAHLAAHLAAHGSSCDALLIALPAWIGASGSAATLTAATGDEIAENGIAETLRRVDRDAPAWVAREMNAAWSTYDDISLAHALHTAASAAAPTDVELRSIDTRAVVISLTNDPFHPIEVARQWSEFMPHSLLVEVDYEMGATAPDFGTAAANALALLL